MKQSTIALLKLFLVKEFLFSSIVCWNFYKYDKNELIESEIKKMQKYKWDCKNYKIQ